MKLARLPAVVLLAAVGLAHAAEPRSAAARPPNIIFILADDLGYGDLGCYGQKRIRTPNLDRMAAEGMRFTQAYAGSTVCAPSRSVLMTGQHTGHTRIRGNARHPLEPGDVTVAEVLRQRGYRTGLVGKWGLGEAGSSGVPNAQGFDYFFGYLNQRHAHNYYPTYLWRNEQKVPLRNVVPNEDPQGSGVATQRIDYSHDLFAAEALQFLDGNWMHPFFLYLAFTTPHANNEAGKKGMEVPNHGDYATTGWPEPQKGHAAMITRMDHDIGHLLGRLKTLGIDSNTIVFFASDNGPHREGGNDPDANDSNGPLRGIKRDLYEGGIRVPAIVRWPGHVPAGQVSEHVWYFADFLPTAAELAGAKPPGTLDGLSLVPTLLGQPEKAKAHAFLYWEFYERGSAQAVRLGSWKAIAQPLGGPIQLYDLSTDAGETSNVATNHPEVVKQARRFMDKAHVPSPLWSIEK